MLTIVVSIAAGVAVGLGMMTVIPASSSNSQWIGPVAIVVAIVVGLVFHGAESKAHA